MVLTQKGWESRSVDREVEDLARPARPFSITRQARGGGVYDLPLEIGSWGTQKHQIWWVGGAPEVIGPVQIPCPKVNI